MLLKFFMRQVYHSPALNGKCKSPKCDYGADEIAPYKTRLATLPRRRCSKKRDVSRGRKSKRTIDAKHNTRKKALRA